MKKNVLALSITTALVGFGFAGGAQAIGLDSPTPPTFQAVATGLAESNNGIGHFNLVPYFTVQGNNSTLINIVNSDTINGKAVKVRFRGAANSDDLYDFQVFLSPGDVWSANVSKDAAGKARLTTADESCTKPDKAVLNVTSFSTVRLDQKRVGDALLNETREGYVEIFNMADIPPTSNGVVNPLFTAIKHVSGAPNTAPPCRTTPSNAAFVALDFDALNVPAANAKGLYAPSTGLFTNWIILNVTDAGSWSGQATAIVAVDGTFTASTGAVSYFPQTTQSLGAIASSRIGSFTADPVLRANPSMAATYDIPDFSIPYTSASIRPEDQVALLSATISSTRIMNEYLTNKDIQASTDWVLSMPTRRYSVAYDYTAGTALYTKLPVDYFTAANTSVIDRQVCVGGTTLSPTDTEETVPTVAGAGVIVSPQVPGKVSSFNVCGEASVLSFNNGEAASSTGLITSASGTFKSTVARSAIDLPGYKAGWASLATPGINGKGLPILGYQAIRAAAGSTAFGATFGHRTN